jgi:hypothetical protein
MGIKGLMYKGTYKRIAVLGAQLIDDRTRVPIAFILIMDFAVR